MKTDEELISMTKSGDENAEMELICRYKDLVAKISRGFFIVGGDIEDLIQEGMIGLYHAIKAYDLGRSDAKFKTFAVTCIKHQIQTAIKRANTNKNRPLSNAVSFQSFSDNNEETFPVELVFDDTPAKTVIEKEDYDELQKKIKSILSPMEFSVLKFYLQGYSYREISNRLNIQSKSIDNSLSRIKLKLRDKLKIA